MSAADGLVRYEEVAGALQFANANSGFWGIHIVRLGKPTPATLTIFG